MKQFWLIVLITLPINGLAQSLDLSFDPGTGANGEVRSIAIQNDGKYVIGGGFTVYNGVARNYVARVNINGSLDLSFNPGTGTNNWLEDITLQADDKSIIV